MSETDISEDRDSRSAADEELDAGAQEATEDEADRVAEQAADAPIAEGVEEADDHVVDPAEVDPAEDDGAEDDGAEPEGPLDVESEVAADYLEELLDIADLDGDIDTFIESGRAHVAVITDSEVLVGRNGEVLDALQELARLAVLAETGHRSRLMLDIAGHRDRRRRELADLAADAIEEVRATGEPVRLSPMNPFERKVVHDAVAAAGLHSESEGEEPQRRVVVTSARD